MAARTSHNWQNDGPDEDRDDEIPYIPPRNEEQLLIGHLSSFRAERILCTSFGRGQLAGFLKSQNPKSRVVCPFLESYYAELAEQYWADEDTIPEIICVPDLPDDEFDAACLCVDAEGDAELTRELLQQAHQRLVDRGEMFCAVNNPDDQWLHKQLQTMFSKVTRLPRKKGVIYSARKTASLKRVRNFSATISVPLSERICEFETRPGVFSHRQIDNGAWALIKKLDIHDNMSVLDLGCGCGVVGIAAMLAANNVSVVAVDSHSRAVQVTQRNAKANLSADQLKQFNVFQSHRGLDETDQRFDLVLANPPYFSNFKIADLFITTASQVLKMNGTLLLVTKTPKWYVENIVDRFENISVHSSGRYQIIEARPTAPHG